MKKEENNIERETTKALSKTNVGNSALLDWNEKVKSAKIDFAIAFTKWVNSPEYKKMVEKMKRIGDIR